MMYLHNTLERRGFTGSGRFTLELRAAVVVDICNAVTSEDFSSVIDTPKIFRRIRTEIVQQVLSGIEPKGPNVDDAQRHAASVQDFYEPDHWGFVRAYILDADGDARGLDATSVVLKHLSVAAADIETRLGTSTWGPYPKDNTPPPLAFVNNARELIGIINERLRLGDVGVQFVAGDVRDFVMSPEPLLHDEIVAPTLHALARHEDLADTEKEYTDALSAWKREDYKEAVDAAYESVEGMLRGIARLEGIPHYDSLLIKNSVRALKKKRLWHPTIGNFMENLQGVRNALGGHSEGTKPPEERATAEDAATAVFIAGALLVHLAAVFERLSAEKG